MEIRLLYKTIVHRRLPLTTYMLIRHCPTSFGHGILLQYEGLGMTWNDCYLDDKHWSNDNDNALRRKMSIHVRRRETLGCQSRYDLVSVDLAKAIGLLPPSRGGHSLMTVTNHDPGNFKILFSLKDSKASPQYHSFGWPVYLATATILGWIVVAKHL